VWGGEGIGFTVGNWGGGGERESNREGANSFERVGTKFGGSWTTSWGGGAKKKDVSRLNLRRDESKREADQVGRKKFAEKPWLPASSAIETKGKRRAPLIALLCSLEKKKEEEKKPSS